MNVRSANATAEVPSRRRWNVYRVDKIAHPANVTVWEGVLASSDIPLAWRGELEAAERLTVGSRFALEPGGPFVAEVVGATVAVPGRDVVLASRGTVHWWSQSSALFQGRWWFDVYEYARTAFENHVPDPRHSAIRFLEVHRDSSLDTETIRQRIAEWITVTCGSCGEPRLQTEACPNDGAVTTCLDCCPCHA